MKAYNKNKVDVKLFFFLTELLNNQENQLRAGEHVCLVQWLSSTPDKIFSFSTHDTYKKENVNHRNGIYTEDKGKVLNIL